MAVPQDCADHFAKWPAFLPRAGTFDAELEAPRSNVAAQRRRLQLAEMSYHSGSSDFLGVLTARTDLYNAEIALIAVKQQRLAAMAGLYRALGGGWIERSGDSPPHAAPGMDIPLAQTQERPRTQG
jgi:multidrug efflux system outer membrane protein